MTYQERLREIKLGLREKECKPKPKKPIAKKSAKKIAADNNSFHKSELEKWFIESRKEMTGICMECGCKTAKDDDKFYKHSICHVLPKRKNMFPSVATNKINKIELCFWGNNCHRKYDSSWKSASQMRVWPLVTDIINKLYPILTKDEKIKVNNIADTVNNKNGKQTIV